MEMKKRIWEILEVGAGEDTISSSFDRFMIVLIILNFAAVILESEDYLNELYGSYFYAFEIISIIIFSIEYVGRIWSCTIDNNYSSPIFGRIKYFFSPLILLDLIAILPFYLAFITIDIRLLRIFRVFRLLRLAKQVKYTRSLRMIIEIFINKKDELITSFIIMITMMFLAATLMFYAENEAQPDKFPSILGSMWWSIVTLTTIGYGDVVPITMMGKMLGCISAIFGVGLFGMPAGIIVSGFSEKWLKNNKNDSKNNNTNTLETNYINIILDKGGEVIIKNTEGNIHTTLILNRDVLCTTKDDLSIKDSLNTINYGLKKLVLGKI